MTRGVSIFFFGHIQHGSHPVLPVEANGFASTPRLQPLIVSRVPFLTSTAKIKKRKGFICSAQALNTCKITEDVHVTGFFYTRVPANVIYSIATHTRSMIDQKGLLRFWWAHCSSWVTVHSCVTGSAPEDHQLAARTKHFPSDLLYPIITTGDGLAVGDCSSGGGATGLCID